MTVSAQLHLEALCLSIGKVWTLSPTFRAEESDTARHLSEFYMLEAELCFTESLGELMDLVEDLIRHIVDNLASSHVGKELISQHPFDQDTSNTGSPSLARISGLLRTERWPRIMYNEALLHLQAATASGRVAFSTPVDKTSGLQTEHEKYLAESIGGGCPVFITDYPSKIKPFYMAPSQRNNPDLGAEPTAACFDLLLPNVCEVAGGSLREHSLELLLEAMEKKGLWKSSRTDGGEKINDSTALDWYVDLRRYGSAPHGGFGLGFDRLIAYLAGIANIRDVVTFPRSHGSCNC